MAVGERQPWDEGQFLLRSLEENRFWLRIMKEHALFLSEGFSRRDSPLIARANRFFREFDLLLREAQALQPRSAEEMVRFNDRVIARVGDFRQFKQDVLIQVILGRIQSFSFPLLIDHIRREAEYFMATLTRLNRGIDEPLDAAIVRENIFWLRIMADHSRFIQHLLDPSERDLIAAAGRLAGEFDRLLAQARDLESMLQGSSPVLVIVGGHLLDEVALVRLREAEEQAREQEERRSLVEPPPPALARLTGEVRKAAEEIRDFKRTAQLLVSESRALSVINPLLADHVRREAEKFLEVLALLEARAQGRFRASAHLTVEEPAPPCEPEEEQRHPGGERRNPGEEQPSAAPGIPRRTPPPPLAPRIEVPATRVRVRF